jgi:creatinine amidohydrolase/Fe(II)-dependent formamide hydrolase-like protein
MTRWPGWIAAFLLLWAGVACAASPRSVFLEELTSAEVAAAIRAGMTTIIITVGGTEQSGPHLALGKHNQRVRVLAGRVAAQLGQALVAPVVAYVPEGRIDPPTAHMRFAGTLSIPEPVFQAMLEAATRSLWQHGFRDVVLIGDHGGYQGALKSLAARLRPPTTRPAARLHFVDAYYQAAQAPFTDLLKASGLTEAQIGSHAGAADTALQMGLVQDAVRPELFAQAAREGRTGGTIGDPRAATAELGQAGAELIVKATVAAIRAAVSSAR